MFQLFCALVCLNEPGIWNSEFNADLPRIERVRQWREVSSANGGSDVK